MNGIGVVLTYLHDFGDVFVSLLKGFVVLGADQASQIALPILLVVWFYTRCIVLPLYIWEIVQLALSGSILSKEVPSHFIAIVYLDLVALALTQLYHFAWFYQLLSIFTSESYKCSKTGP